MPGQPSRVERRHDVVIQYTVFHGTVDDFAPELAIRAGDGSVPQALSFVEPDGRRTTLVLTDDTRRFIRERLSGIEIARVLPPDGPSAN